MKKCKNCLHVHRVDNTKLQCYHPRWDNFYSIDVTDEDFCDKFENIKRSNMKEDNWEHRSKGIVCSTCMWHSKKNDKIGRCRRHAPTISGYPDVYPTDWCGDHKLNEETINAPV